MANRLAGRLWFGAAALALAGGWALDGPARWWTWSAGAALAGLSCVVNTAACGRVHCTFTGPLFLLLALSWAFAGLGAWRPNDTILWVVGVLGSVAAFVPEWLGRRYWRKA